MNNKRAGLILIISALCFSTFIYLYANTSLLYLNKKTAINNGEKFCEVFSHDYDITDENSPTPQEAKTQILNLTKISEEYFKKHFIFRCALEQQDNGQPKRARNAIYDFVIADYSTKIFVGIQPNFIYHIVSDLVNMQEIENIISKKEAFSKLASCLVYNPRKLEVRFDEGKLVLWGTSIKFSGQVNLETGECENVHPI